MNKKEKRELILSVVLGDGSIVLGKEKGAYLSMNHGASQKDYLDWKTNLIDSNECLAHSASKAEYDTKLKDKSYHQYSSRWCDTTTLKLYKKWFYEKGEKTLKNVLPLISSPLALAIFFMDDGSVFKRKRKHKDGTEYFLRPSMKLCSHSYSKEDNELLLKWLKKNYDVEGSIVIERKKQRNAEYFTLWFNALNTKKIWDIIQPYVSEVESMRQKFNFMYQTYSL